jgi:hypothetical protein
MLTGPVIHRAWEITKLHKSLWVLGAFAGTAPTFAFQWQKGSVSLFGGHSTPIVAPAGLAITGLFMLFMAVFIIMHLITSAGLVDAVNRIARGGAYTLSASFSSGLDFFWRFLGLFILYLFASIVLMVALVLPGALCFFINSVFGILSLFVLIPVGIAGFFSIFCIHELARRATVTRNVGIGDAVEEAWYLFRHNLVTNAMFVLVIFILSIAIVLIFALTLAALAAPFVAIAFIPNFGLILALVLGIPVVFLVLVLFNGVAGSFLSAIYTLFYFELLQPATPITIAYPGQPPAL